MYTFTLRYKLEGVTFYTNKLPRKRTTHSDLQECRVISPINLDYNFDLNLQFSSPSAVSQTGRKECWSRSMYRLVARFDLWFTLLFPVPLYSARSLVVVPIWSLVLQSVDLGVASWGNRRYSHHYQSSVLRAFSRLRVLRCDKTVPQCVSSLHDRLDFGWGVLCSRSRNRWSVGIKGHSF